MITTHQIISTQPDTHEQRQVKKGEQVDEERFNPESETYYGVLAVGGIRKSQKHTGLTLTFYFKQ